MAEGTGVITQRLRFTEEETLFILGEVIYENPYEDTRKWEIITGKLVGGTCKNFTVRAVREHVEHHLKIWARENLNNKQKSGIKKEYDEKKKYLQEIYDLRAEIVKSKKKKCSQSQQLGMQARKVACENIKMRENIDPSTIEIDFEENTPADCSSTVLLSSSQQIGPLKRSRTPLSLSMLSQASTSSSSSVSPEKEKRMKTTRNLTLEFMKEKHSHEIDIQKKRMQLEEQQLMFQKEELQFKRDQFNVEKEERMRRLQLEEEERKSYLYSRNYQTDMMKTVLQLLNKPNSST